MVRNVPACRVYDLYILEYNLVGRGNSLRSSSIYRTLRSQKLSQMTNCTLRNFRIFVHGSCFVFSYNRERSFRMCYRGDGPDWALCYSRDVGHVYANAGQEDAGGTGDT
jgi:hypothetical protein